MLRRGHQCQAERLARGGRRRQAAARIRDGRHTRRRHRRRRRRVARRVLLVSSLVGCYALAAAFEAIASLTAPVSRSSAADRADLVEGTGVVHKESRRSGLGHAETVADRGAVFGEGLDQYIRQRSAAARPVAQSCQVGLFKIRVQGEAAITGRNTYEYI